MSDYRSTLERELERLSPPRIPFDQLARRRDRRRRDQRIKAGVLGLAIVLFLGFLGLSLSAIRSAPPVPVDDPRPTTTGPFDLTGARLVDTAVGPSLDPTRTVKWANYDVPATSFGDPHIVRVRHLASGGYVAHSVDPGFVWFSRDGSTWYDVSDQESVYSYGPFWMDDEWALASTRSKTTILHRDGDEWEILASQRRFRFSRPVVSDGTTLFVGYGVDEDVLLIWDGSGVETVDAPWVDLEEEVDGLGQNDLVVATATGFVGLVTRHEGDLDWLSGPTELWTSADGREWTQAGEIPFAESDATGIKIAGGGWTGAGRASEPMVSMTRLAAEGAGPTTSYWTTSDGLTWTETDGPSEAGRSPVDGYSFVAEDTDSATVWHGKAWIPRQFGTGLVLPGDPFTYSADQGETWLEVGPDDLGGPLVPFSENGIAGDILFSSGADGLWIGVSPPAP